MQRKLDWLALDPEKPDSYGNVYINMKFDDGTVAYKAGKPGDMTQHYADLLGIQKSGELVEIELEDTGKTTAKGAKKYKLVGYPGWSAPVAQGGKAQANASGGGYGGSWYNSEEGVHFTQERMDRRTALMQAVELATTVTQVEGPLSEKSITMVAELMYAWLQETVRGEGQQDAEVRASGDEAAKPITERTTDPIPASTSVPAGNHGEGATGAAVSEGGPGLTGGSRAGPPEDADSPWAGMGVD